MNARPHIPLIAAIIATCCAHTLAGDTDPPAGPVTPTMKTLDEVEPRTIINATNTPGDAASTFKITTPGSYYLIGNVNGEAGKIGIEITADNVSIDLMGHHLAGIAGSAAGVRTTVFGLEAIEVRNGSASGWGGHAFDLGNTSSSIVQDLRAHDNSGSGVFAGDGAVVARCTAQANQSHGIVAGDTCSISHCVAKSNSSGGIIAGNQVSITHCAASENGLAGILAFDRCTVSDCTVYLSGINGISVRDSSTVIDCVSAFNTGVGIDVIAKCLVRNNISHDNGGGIFLAAGIHAALDDNRIDANHCIDNPKGILIDGERNYIVRNTCTDNSLNFEFAANNRFGPIIDHTTSVTIPVAGNSAGSALNSVDPWANFANKSP